MREANMVTTASAAQVLSELFGAFPRSDGETLVLVYLDEMRDASGVVPKGFRPGYTPSVWPVGYASPEWAFGQLSDGRTFSLVPISGSEKDERFVVDVLDERFDTFSVTRQ